MPPAAPASTSGVSSEAAWSMTGDRQRSSFVFKLHELLCEGEHPECLHWVNNDTFAITSLDENARLALSPHWDFNSLSSFIRQLSYYSFKRLTDRRRSTERRPSLPAYIVFTHPSGNFVRDDRAKALLIPRKIRARKGVTRKDRSTADAEEARPSPSSPAASTRSTALVPAGSPPRADMARNELRSCLERFQLPTTRNLYSVSTAPIPPRAMMRTAAPPGLSRRPEDGSFILHSRPTRAERQYQAHLVESEYPTPAGSGGAYFDVPPEQTVSIYSSTEGYYAAPTFPLDGTSARAQEAHDPRANGMVYAPRTPPPSGEDSSPAVPYGNLPYDALAPPKYIEAAQQFDNICRLPPFAEPECRYQYIQLSLVQSGLSPPPSPPLRHSWSPP